MEIVEIISFFQRWAGVIIIMKFFILLTSSLLVVIFFNKFSKKINLYVTRHFGRSLGIGAITLIVKPIILFILLATIVGSLVAVAGGLIYMLLVILARVMVGILVGAWLAKRLTNKLKIDWRWTIAGVVVIQILGLVPIIGPALIIVLFVAIFGAISRLYHTKLF